MKTIKDKNGNIVGRSYNIGSQRMTALYDRSNFDFQDYINQPVNNSADAMIPLLKYYIEPYVWIEPDMQQHLPFNGIKAII
jgi:hypothetical protein